MTLRLPIADVCCPAKGQLLFMQLIGGGGFFSFIFGLFVVTTVLNVVRSVVSRRGNDDDEF